MQRLNVLKWMVFVFFISILFELVALSTWFTLMSEFGVSDLGAIRVLQKNLTLTFSLGSLSEFIFLEITDPWASNWGMMILCIPLIPCLFLLLLNLFPFPFLKRRLIDLFLTPVYRAWTLRGISEILKSDSRIVHVLRESSQIHPLRMVRPKLALIANQVENGLSIQDAFTRGGLIRRSQRGLLMLAKDPSQLAWTLRQIAERNFFRWIEWYSMCIDVAALLLMLLTATFVGAFAFVQFQFLVHIIFSGI